MSSLTLHPGLVCILFLAASVLAAMFAKSRVARRRLATPTLPTQVAELPQQSAPQRAIPTRSAEVPTPTLEVAARAVEAMPAFTGPAISDVGCLGYCLCGVRSLHSSPLSTLATCSSCARTWAVVRTHSYFVPIGAFQAFAAYNKLEHTGQSS